MADGVQNFVENNEEQEFSMHESGQHHLVGSVEEFDHQNMVENYHNFSGDVSDNQGLEVNGQGFGTDEQENNFGVLSDQVFADNQNHHTLDGDEPKVEFTNNEGDETGNPPEKKDETQNNSGNVANEKKWPGYPGESVFRILVPTQKVGNIIGRKGEYIKKMVEETRARIKVLDGPPGSQQRAVLISAKEVPDSSLPPAMDGLLRIHKRIVDGLDTEDPSQAPPSGGKVSTRLLVPATQAGSLIGKQGATVKSIQESASCIVRVLGQDDLPVFALQDDRVVEVVGEAVNVHKAVELIGQHLRKFLVDRGIISVFEKQMQAPATPMGHMPPQPWGPPHHPQSGGYNMQYMQPPPRQVNNYYPPATMAPPPDRQPHHGISAYGREPPIGANASSNTQAASSMITQMTQHMQVPLIYADNVIGASGATISYIRRASGATVTVQETRGAPGEMTVEISGTASQVQTAQQLIQNFMAEAAAAANTVTAATQTGGATDQSGYNTYAAAPAPVYGTTPSSAAHPTQPVAYGSVYGANYSY